MRPPSRTGFLIFTLLSIGIYAEIFSYASFGPELGFFYQINARLSFWGMLHKYVEFGEAWYRPTAFFAPYFVISKIFGWQHILIWKLADFLTLLAACWALYALTLLLLPGQQLGGFLACLYLAAHPSVYLPLFEISAFDFPYLFFVIASAICFLRAWRAGPRAARRWNLAGVCAYALALTAKETAILTPVYLAAAAVVLLLAEGEAVTRKARLRRAGRLLAPYAVVLGLFVLLHVTRMPERPATAAYRTRPNLARILENARKYPLWMVHIFSHTGDTVFHAREQATPQNDVFGALVLALLLVQWGRDFRRRVNRIPALLLALWILIFSAVPVYAGGYLWHNNLALCGYAVLAGVGLARFVEVLRSRALKRLYLVALVGVFLALGRVDVHNALYAGVHATAFRLNSAALFVHPPVARQKLGAAPLIFIEDRLELTRWAYGSGNLFPLVYQRPEIRQEEVPAMDHVPVELCRRWLAEKNAFFFRYDDQFRWYDATAEFTRYALARLYRTKPERAASS